MVNLIFHNLTQNSMEDYWRFKERTDLDPVTQERQDILY